MNDIQFKLDDHGKGAFIIEEGGEQLGEMVFAIQDQHLTVYHTQVSDKLKGQGAATKMLTQMVDYARAHNLKVIPLCPFVSAQFARHEALYKDVWEKNWHSK